MANNKEQQRGYARLLFIYQDKNYTEIADTVKVNINTVSRWASEENWQAIKEAENFSSKEIVINAKKWAKFLTDEINKRENTDGEMGQPSSNELIRMDKLAKIISQNAMQDSPEKIAKNVVDFVEHARKSNKNKEFISELSDLLLSYIQSL